MSYIIAFVSYSESGRDFPVQCFRTDLSVGDEVVVRRTDGKLRIAAISQLQYLNWDCNGRIECRREEASLDEAGNINLPKGSPLHVGTSTQVAFTKSLKASGWVPIKSRQKMYRAVLACVNKNSISYIFTRKNGIDIQIIPKVDENPVKPYSYYEGSLGDGRVVRHSLAHTTFNLLEGVLRFANSFQNNEEDLDRYFVPQGSTDKRTEELKQKAKERKASRNEMLDIYDACSDGSGGPAYLGDGVWIDSGGSLHDWGR